MRSGLKIERYSLTAAIVFGLPLCHAAPAVDFATEVRPILARSCYGCHSADQTMAGLRLDQEAGARRVIVAGNSAASPLIQRLVAESPDKRMPLGVTPLSADQIAVLRRWIDSGAPWSETAQKKHWAYERIERPAAPKVRNEAWIRNPMDAFVLARLEKEGLKPSPEARPEKLVRRLHLDLIGLPPTPRELDEYLSDTRPDAYQRLVERLLSSPHYGERWARPWLDYSRYADTHGYEKDRRRTAWKYRDWLIEALNSNIGFDQFTLEQLAGDMLPGATDRHKIATGFHRNTMFNEEGGVDKDEAHWINLVDRTNTTATVWLGSTLACAQCHDHKYDPFTQREYYQFLAFFSNTVKTTLPNGSVSQVSVEPTLDLPTPEQEGRRKELRDQIDRLEKEIKEADLREDQTRWERSILGASSRWVTLKPRRASSAHGAVVKLETDGRITVSGPNERDETYEIELEAPLRGITALRLEALPHPDLPRGGPGRDAYGNFAITTLEADGFRICEILADDGSVHRFRKGVRQAWIVDATRDEKRVPRQLILAADGAFTPSNGVIRMRIRQDSPFNGQGIGHFRLSATTSEEPARIADVSARLRSILEKEPDQRTADEQRKLSEFYRGQAPALEMQRRQLKASRDELEKLGIVTAMILEEDPSGKTPSTEMRIRGSFLSKGDTVEAGVPAFLNPWPEGESRNRLSLARWIVSRDNPLTARVTVNRIWEQYFGRGIVETSEDFGTQSEAPTHPDLMDWLAVEFMESGWDLKRLHRLIVDSATYRQDSAVSADLLARDPYNRLLARGARFRMEAEMIRDATLATSGLLSRKIGGPSVFPPQPEGVWQMPFSDDKWEESEGEDKYRRGIYTFIRRTAAHPSLLNFDATSREACIVRRVRTNTPLQALTTWNDPAFFEAAQALARRMVSEGGDGDAARLRHGFRLTTARLPSDHELERLLAALDEERRYFSERPEEASRLAPNRGADIAAWTMIANSLLNLDEMLTRE